MNYSSCYPYLSDNGEIKLVLQRDEFGALASRKITFKNEEPKTPTTSPMTTGALGNYMFEYSKTRTGIIVNIKTSFDRYRLSYVEWMELTSNSYTIDVNNFPQREGKQIMSALFLGAGEVVINGVLYSESNPDAFTEDLTGNKEYSILEIMNLYKVYNGD